MDNSFYFKFLRDKYAALRDHKILFSFILIAILIFSVYLISAASFEVTTVPASINEDLAGFTTVNFTFNNTQRAQNITNFTILLPSGFTANNFNITSNGSTADVAGTTGVAYFNSSGRNITWVNATNGLINSSVNRSFWIDINQSMPGTYNITINITYANLSTDSYNQSFVVNDTTIPAVTINLQNNSNLTAAEDYFNVTVIDVSKNLTGVFAALKNITGYYSLSGSVITEGSDYMNWTNVPSFNATRYSNNISSNNFADGPYFLYVNATDNATNNGTAPRINITIDNTAPTAINLVQPLNATISTNRTPTLQWEPTADITFINYTVQIDDNSDFSSITNTTGTYLNLNTTNKTGVTGITLGADTTYYWRVTAWDAVDQSAVTKKFVYTTDNTAPVLTINLQNNSNLTAAEDYFNVTVTDANKNYTGVFAAIKNSTGYYNLSGSNITDGSDYLNWTNVPSFNATRYSNNISSNNFADGPYFLYVNATDYLSNNATAPRINITIDNTAPVVGLMSPENATQTTTAAQVFQCNATDQTEIINITLQIYDSLNSSSVKINMSSASAGYNQTSFAYTLPYLGDFLWNCRVNDTLNNTGWASSNRTIALGTEAAAATTSSSGGGGGTAPGMTYDSGVLMASITQELKMGETAKFTVEGASHTVRIMGLTASTASVQIRSILITKLLALGAPAEEVDIDNDGVNELSLKLESISLSSSKVNITITPLVGAIAAPVTPTENVTGGAGGSAAGSSAGGTASSQEESSATTTTTTGTGTGNTGLIVAILLISVVAIIIGVILLKKSNKPIWKLWT